MIAANEAVARHLIARGTPTVFRHHEDPAQSAIEMLYAKLEELEVATPPLPDGPLGPADRRAAAAAAADAVARHLGPGGDPRSPLWGLVLRALRQAHYSASEVTHSGLASSAYLHFTSPIRRYPDLLVHRGLLDSLGIGDPGPARAELEAAAEDCSGTEREAAAVERRADDICAAYLLREWTREAGGELTVEGRITGVIDAGLFVSFDEVFTGFLPARSLEEDRYRCDPLEVMLVGARTGRRHRLGDELRAHVERIEPLRGRILLAPAGEGSRGRGRAARRRPGAR